MTVSVDNHIPGDDIFHYHPLKNVIFIYYPSIICCKSIILQLFQAEDQSNNTRLVDSFIRRRNGTAKSGFIQASLSKIQGHLKVFPTVFKY